MGYENLLVERKDGVAVVTVNRPKKLNALNTKTIEELDAAFAALASDAEVRGVVLTGAGEKAFVAGADIKEMIEFTPMDMKEFCLRGQSSLATLEELGKPVIATAWSGNMDFMTEQNACLVGYSLVPVQDETQAAYRPEFAGPDARWAEPRLDEAAHWMRRLAEDREFRERIGKRAAADMAERHARLSTDELLAAIRHVQEVKGSESR